MDDGIKAGFQRVGALLKPVQARQAADSPTRAVPTGTSVPAGTPDGTIWIEYVP